MYHYVWWLHQEANRGLLMISVEKMEPGPHRPENAATGGCNSSQSRKPAVRCVYAPEMATNLSSRCEGLLLVARGCNDNHTM